MVNKVRFQPTRPLRGATKPPNSAAMTMIIFQPTRPLRGATSCSGARSTIFIETFQPTRPLRGATETAEVRPAPDDISTHAPLAGRDFVAGYLQTLVRQISTHAPLAGRDRELFGECEERKYFNPRAPCGARQITPSCTQTTWPISTHAPLAGRDVHQRPDGKDGGDFNPRAPCGARRRS